MSFNLIFIYFFLKTRTRRKFKTNEAAKQGTNAFNDDFQFDCLYIGRGLEMSKFEYIPGNSRSHFIIHKYRNFLALKNPKI